MGWDKLPVDQLAIWAQFNGVDFNGVKACSVGEGRGSGLVATWESENDAVLLSVPQDLVLSLETVWIYAKSDHHLLQVLEAVGEFSTSPRGAILVFLLLQLTNVTTHGQVGVLNPFTDYVRYLPKQTSLPIFWGDAEKSLLVGTSLEAALGSKLKNLSNDFNLLQEKTASIDWCTQHWWNIESVGETFEAWKQVDALYRSRALDLPGTGHAMVPCIDMANHASGDETTALYETKADGSAILLLRPGKKVYPGDEITITYGDDKGACEMLYSYGFIEDTMRSARALFLDLKIPDDDPLRHVKKAVSELAPGVRLYLHGINDMLGWESPFVWLSCINEEDGLAFKQLQKINGECELRAYWKEEEINDFANIEDLLQKDPAWDIYSLRAIFTLQQRVAQQKLRLEDSLQYVKEIWEIEDVDDNVYDNVMKLRDLENSLLQLAFEYFCTKRVQLEASPVVKKYLASANGGEEQGPEDDFS